MGVSISKSSQSGPELLAHGRGWNGVTRQKQCTDVEEASRLAEPYTHLQDDYNETSQPVRQEADVIQILCAADDEDLDDKALEDICKKLDTDSATERPVAKIRFNACKNGGCTKHQHLGPVLISTLAERPTRVNSTNFSPHAVVTGDADFSVNLETEISETDNNDFGQDSTKSNVLFNAPIPNTGLRITSETKTLKKDVAMAEHELDKTTKIVIEELLAIDVDLPEETSNRNNAYRHSPLPSEASGMQSPTSACYSKESNSTIAMSVDASEDCRTPSGRFNSAGNVSNISDVRAPEQVYANYWYDVRKRIKNQGFFDKFPTPGVISDAQTFYRKLDLPVPTDKDGNILPHPSKFTKEDVFTTSGSSEIDFRILNAPQPIVQENNPPDVVAYLCKGLHDNMDKIRAISTWLAVRQVQEMAGSKSVSDTSGKWCKVFRTMCRCCKIKATLIDGIIRGPTFLPGDDLEAHKSIWVAVLVNNSWWIVDPVLRKSMSNDFAETANKHLTVPTDNGASPGLFSYTESFFSDPEQFIFTHYPDDNYWQLLARPVDKAELSQLALLRHGFFALGMRLVNQSKSVIIAGKEDVLVTLEFPENTHRQFMCKLFYCDNAGLEAVTKLSRGSSVSSKRCIFTETVLNKHLVNIKVRLPKNGSYLLDVFGCSECHPWQKVITYKLVCEDHIGTRSFPISSREEWGPGMDACAMGLSPVSHHGAEIVIDKVITQISFKDTTGLQFKQELLNDGATVNTDQIKLSFLRDKGQEVVFIVDVEPKLLGTYILQLSARSDTSKPFTNFCNYLIKKVECVKERTSAIPRFDFPVRTEQKTIHKAPDTGRLLLEFEVPNVCDLDVKFKLHDKQQLNYSEHARKWIEDNRGYVDLNFPRRGRYSVKIQTKTTDDAHFKTVREEHFQVDIPSCKWSPFPKLETSWTSQFRIEEPLNHHLQEKEDQTFTVYMKNVQDVAVLAARGWYHLDQIEDGVWKGQVWTGPRATKCRLLTRFEVGSEKFSELLWFKVIAEEDYYKLEDRQDTLRENAFKERRHQR